MQDAQTRRLAQVASHMAPLLSRADTSAGTGLRVCVVGAAGGIGQPLALLLKQSARIATLHLYDVASTAGVKADLSHINTGAKVR